MPKVTKVSAGAGERRACKGTLTLAKREWGKEGSGSFQEDVPFQIVAMKKQVQTSNVHSVVM